MAITITIELKGGEEKIGANIKAYFYRIYGLRIRVSYADKHIVIYVWAIRIADTYTHRQTKRQTR